MPEEEVVDTDVIGLATIPFTIGELPTEVEGESRDLQLGPLRFAAPLGEVGEAIGDGLEAVGAALVAAERRPRPVKLRLPVRGVARDDPMPEGQRLRRQLRQVMNNAKMRLQGLFLYWTLDPDMDSWLMVGQGELPEASRGIGFAEWDLELSDVYLVGRPGTHRPGRRLALADRRSALVPRDTRRTLYSADFASTPALAEPMVLPGDIQMVARSSRETVPFPEPGLEDEAGHLLWNTYEAEDGEVYTYDPTSGERNAYLELDEIGCVRIWDTSYDEVLGREPGEYTLPGDKDPADIYKWERVFGDLLHATPRLAIENGAVRIVSVPDINALSIERWKEEQGYVRVALIAVEGPLRGRVIEYTPERGVIELTDGSRAIRVVLQRGWWGPRLEKYVGSAVAPSLSVTIGSAAKTLTRTPDGTLAWVQKLKGGTTGEPSLLWAQGTNDESWAIATHTATVKRATGKGVIVAQLMLEPASLAEGAASNLGALALTDAQMVPVLVTR